MRKPCRHQAGVRHRKWMSISGVHLWVQNQAVLIWHGWTMVTLRGADGRMWKTGVLVVKLACKEVEMHHACFWGSTLLVCPVHGLLLIHHLNSTEGSLLKGFFEEPGTATQVAGSFSVLLGPSGSVSFPPVSPRSHLCNNDSEANNKYNCLADGLGSYWLALS